MLYNSEIENIVQKLKIYNPQKIILFGSYARGDINEASDIDMLIIKDTKTKFIERIDEVLDICNGCPKLEPLIYTPDEIANMLANQNDFICTVLKEGVVVYEQ